MTEPQATVARPELERVAELGSVFLSEAGFRAFYEAALPIVYGYLFNRCGRDPTLAEDLTQLAFTEAVRAHRTYDGRSEPITWLVGIARHKLIDHFRAQDRDEHRRLRLVVREIALDREQATWRESDEREALVRALARLPAIQRAVLVLHYADGLPVKEIARQVGRSESATESLMTRAREALRAAYEEAGDD